MALLGHKLYLGTKRAAKGEKHSAWTQQTNGPTASLLMRQSREFTAEVSFTPRGAWLIKEKTSTLHLPFRKPVYPKHATSFHGIGFLARARSSQKGEMFLTFPQVSTAQGCSGSPSKLGKQATRSRGHRALTDRMASVKGICCGKNTTLPCLPAPFLLPQCCILLDHLNCI